MAVVPTEGTTIGYGDTLGGSFTTVAQVLGIGPPKPKVNPVRTTTLTSSVQTARAGRIPDMGEASLHIQYDPNDAGHIALRDLIGTPTTNNKYFLITYADTYTTKAIEKFQAIVTGFEPDDFDDGDEANQSATLTLKVISAISRVVGS